MALMGVQSGRPSRWLRDNRAALPSMVALLAGAALWVVGVVGGLGYLSQASSPMAMLTGLSIGLAAVAASIIVAILALIDLAGRYSWKRTRR
ncbi:hypothetical protein [Arthrobacter agilis]|uniref:hypothetical protein n=1 Tax=Arthrobacter agilis TaxID=37921 RepID=UPI00278352DA|nr:hypothetical protein [Arthrobacter agilis]MDQ0734655.1 hypothetical protein [Arthrobacter agilis]